MTWPVLALDIESIPDIDGLRQLRGLDPAVGNAEVYALEVAERKEAGKSDFMPLHLQRVLVISCVFRNADGLRVHSFVDLGLSGYLLAFLFAFPRTRWGNRVCILNTRGGVRLFGLYLPGLSGAARPPARGARRRDPVLEPVPESPAAVHRKDHAQIETSGTSSCAAW